MVGLIRLINAKGNGRIYNLANISEEEAKADFMDDTGVKVTFSSSLSFDYITRSDLSKWAMTGDC